MISRAATGQKWSVAAPKRNPDATGQWSPSGSAAERSQHLARRKSIYEAMHPETTHGAVGRGGKRDADSASLSFTADTAKKTGVAARTIAEDVQIGTNLADDVMEKVKESHYHCPVRYLWPH